MPPLKRFFLLAKLLRATSWPSYLIFLFCVAVHRATGISLIEGIPLRFRQVKAWARTRGSNGFGALFEMFLHGEYKDFDTSPKSGITLLLDAGANCGFFAILRGLENPSLVTHCFEPLPSTVEVLRKNVELNGLSDRIHVQEYAVGDSEGDLTLHFSGDGSMASADADYATGANSKSITVKQTSMDAFCKREDIHPDAIKIDVEGHELEVLAGASEVLGTVKAVVMETHSESLHRDSREQLQSHHFEVTEDHNLLYGRK